MTYATWESEYRDDADFTLEEQTRRDDELWEQQTLDESAAHELEQERQQICEWALREYLTLGGKIEHVKHLASECGISYDRIIGNI